MTAVWKRVLLWGVLMLLLGIGLAYAFWPQPVLVDMTAVVRGPLIVTIDEEGETRVEDIFVLSAPVTGEARRIEAEVGDWVTAGETLLAEIEPIDPDFLDVRSGAQAEASVKAAEAAVASARAELERERAELAFAVAELGRAQRLIEKGTISERSLDKATREHRTRRAAVDRARASLQMHEFELTRAQALLISPATARNGDADCECVPIIAPVSGRVLRVIHKSRGVVRSGDPLLEIGDPGRLEIVADLLSSDAVKVRAGQRVVLDHWGGETPLNGRVRQVEPFGFTKVSALGIEEQRVNVVIDLEDPPDLWQALGHGYQLEVHIVILDRRDALKIPLSALFRDGEAWALFVVADDRAQSRQVEIGARTDLEAEILSGLREDDAVILHPNPRIADGIRILERP